jgi:hypothetical protein
MPVADEVDDFRPDGTNDPDYEPPACGLAAAARPKMPQPLRERASIVRGRAFRQSSRLPAGLGDREPEPRLAVDAAMAVLILD